MLVPVSVKAAVDAADKVIAEEASGIQTGLATRWPAINRSLLKYARFGDIYTIAGASGAAKSFILNMLRTDFITKDIEMPFTTNDSEILNHITEKAGLFYTGKELIKPKTNIVDFDVVILHFGFEMSPYKEVIRTVADWGGMNYAAILSSKAKKISNGNYEYIGLTNSYRDYVKAILTGIEKTNILFFNTPGTVEDIERTVEFCYNKYVRDSTRVVKLIVMLDHTLLLSTTNEKGDLEVVNKMAKAAIVLKEQYNAMLWILSQLNNSIEDDKRRNTPALHYPTKKDMYVGGQLYQASDAVYTALMPAKLGILNYGPKKVTTNGIIHIGNIKSRNDDDGQIWLSNHLAEGKLKSIYPIYDGKGEFTEWSY